MNREFLIDARMKKREEKVIYELWSTHTSVSMIEAGTIETLINKI